MDLSSIASSGISSASSGLQTSVALALTKKAMDTEEVQGQQLIQSMQAAATGVGQNVDIKA